MLHGEDAVKKASRHDEKMSHLSSGDVYILLKSAELMEARYVVSGSFDGPTLLQIICRKVRGFYKLLEDVSACVHAWVHPTLLREEIH